MDTLLTYYKDGLATLAVILTVVAYIPYTRSILRGRTRPHVFSWLVWGVINVVVFFAQLADKGGAGAWPTGISGLGTLLIAFLSWQHKGDIHITRSDWCFFVGSLLAIPLWPLTSDPFLSVLVLTIIDVLAMGPTLRKSYYRPDQERASLYATVILRYILAIFALENYTATTMMFHVASIATCVVLISVILIRKEQLALKAEGR